MNKKTDYISVMFVTRYIPRCLSFALALSGFSADAVAANLDGVFDAGWTTAYQSADSINHMHKRLHALGMEQVALQYAAVEKTHLYYPSQLDFLQNTEYKNNQLFPKSIDAAKAAGNKLWLGLYYDGENWYIPPTISQLDTLAARNIKVLDELHALYGNETVIEGVYIPQEIARYYWDGLREDATATALTTHFLIPVTRTAQAKGWKVMTAPFYNQNLETPEKLQAFFESLFATGFMPDVIAVQDGIGASDAGKAHADISTVGNYERAIANACSQYGIEFWVDMELFRTDDSHALADNARLSAQLDTARTAGASKVIAYDLAVLGNAGLDSLEKWFARDSSQATSIKIRRNPNKSQKLGGQRHKEIRYYKLNGARVKASE
jgi:hypothetical protein